MPSLSINTTPTSCQAQDQTPHSSAPRRAASPERPPPFSPITPVLGPSRASTSVDNSPLNAIPARRSHTHSQPSQTVIPQPPPVPIEFESNPDVLATRSAIGILQLQARNARTDIQTLQQIKERALSDPRAFVKAATTGEVTSAAETLLGSSRYDHAMADVPASSARESWPKIPIAQDIVRCPPINWHQYAVDGQVLDRLHSAQQARPSEGAPQQMSADGQVHFGGEGQRRSTDSVATPYQPGKDRIEKPSTKKGSRR